jgi:phosphatidate cytidylyltransferase
MLRTRLWMGAILIAVSVGVLVVDQWLAPWYPFLLVVILGLSEAACFELLSLLDPERRPAGWLCHSAVAVVVLANWAAQRAGAHPWTWVAIAFAAVVLAIFLYEMAMFREPGQSVTRIALAVWVAAYLGLLPSFLAQMRWLGPQSGALALALAIFVPKMCDTGAYFTGRLLGKHPMAPVLSPKKTWEGAAGGIGLAIVTAVVIDLFGPVLPGVLAAIGFGITVGAAGMLGDLAESLIKRDCQKKDASQIMPGFGGVLDVVDSIVFAAPVAYWWFI